MKHLRRNAAFWIICFALVAMTARAAALPADWQHDQAFDVTNAGLVKISLPIETLESARPGLEDVRVYDDAGNEVSYLIEHPVPASRAFSNAKSFQATLNTQTTVLTLETGITNPVDAIALDTPANNFIKSALVEGSTNGRDWREIVRGNLIFSQPTGVSKLQIIIPPHVWTWLRLTVDDQRTQPVPFIGAHVEAAPGQFAPSEEVPVTIADRQESPGETRLTLRLPSANLDLSTVSVFSPEPLFTRRVTFAVPQIERDSVQEQSVGGGVIYAIAIEGQPPSTNLSVALNAQVRSRELLMLIHNLDSAPLLVTGAHAQRKPVYLVFLAKQAGAYHLLSGNPKCASPQYDLAAFRARLNSLAVAPMTFSPVTNNPAYHPPEVLPEVQNNGADIGVIRWEFRKPIKITRGGVQELEPDLDVVSHSRPGFEDVRVLRDNKQVPYILERTSINRGTTPHITVTNDFENPHLSRWILKLPRARLPVNRLVCQHSALVFQRNMVLYEELKDDQGEKYRHILSQSTWTQMPNHIGKEFTLTLDSPPQSDTLYLETDNGDNPSIELENFSLFYPVARLLFKAQADDTLLLYYGDPEGNAPHYDLSLVANELMAADKATASLGAEQVVKKLWRTKGVSGNGGVIFWGILALVVVALLVVIARLLPRQSDGK